MLRNGLFILILPRNQKQLKIYYFYNFIPSFDTFKTSKIQDFKFQGGKQCSGGGGIHPHTQMTCLPPSPPDPPPD